MSAAPAKPEGPLIAVDMDDVLCQTAGALADWHNTIYGTSMSVNDTHYYHLWKNEYWGTQLETREKLKVFQENGYENLEPIPGSLEALRGLKSLGFRLIILTARSHEHEQHTIEWIDKYLPDVFDEVIFTSHFAVMDKAAMKANPWAGKPKAEVVKAKNGVLLIDDSLENGMICASQGIHVLLFGLNPWSTRHSTTNGPLDLLSRSERIKAGDDGFWEREVMKDFPEDVKPFIRRVPGWMEVLDWVRGQGNVLLNTKAVTGVEQGPPLRELERLGDEVIVD